MNIAGTGGVLNRMEALLKEKFGLKVNEVVKCGKKWKLVRWTSVQEVKLESKMKRDEQVQLIKDLSFPCRLGKLKETVKSMCVDYSILWKRLDSGRN